MKHIPNIFLFLHLVCAVTGLTTENIAIVILSQENKYNALLATNLKLSICHQASDLNQKCPKIYLSHEDFDLVGEWTVTPILPRLAALGRNVSWIILLEERTKIRLKLFLETLNKYDEKKDIWIGYGLVDTTPTVIHHFQDNEFKYPHFGAGTAITSQFIQRLSNSLTDKNRTVDFSIDKSYEFASFVWNNGNRVSLIHDKAFCAKEDGEHCTSFPRSFEVCESPIPAGNVYVAVKTCSKFHSDRLPVVLSTWAKHTEKVEFFSDIVDPGIPTVSLGIPNTESGHCGKTLGILNYLYKKIENDYSVQWIVIVDDDTILSISRLLELLSCYDSSDDVCIGERYGYGVHNSLGFNYITGGGGMVFSRSLVKKLVEVCECPSISSPDDMVLGYCIGALGVKVTHSYLFHQARPTDYSPDFLKCDRHLSFHKHWMLDPVEVYNQWFAEEDNKLKGKIDIKTEL